MSQTDAMEAISRRKLNLTLQNSVILRRSRTEHIAHICKA